LNKFHSLFLLLLLAGCGKNPDQAAFTGTWNFIEENSITGATETVQVTVNALPPRFRLTTANRSSEEVEVYDGTALHTKYISKAEHSAYEAENPIDSEADETPVVSEPRTESAAMTKNQAMVRRFWAQPISGDSVPGGLVAGRDTVLHESKWKRPDGEFSLQVWADAKTDIILKSVESVYSSQAQTLVHRSIKECVTIDFTPPGEATFTQP